MGYTRIKGHVVKRNRNQTNKTVAELLADALATVEYAHTVIPEPIYDGLADHIDGQAEEIIEAVQNLRSTLLTQPRQ